VVVVVIVIIIIIFLGLMISKFFAL